MVTAYRRRIEAAESVINDAVRLGVWRNSAQDERLDGRTVIVEGTRQINFASCSYLGLELHPEVKQGAIDATERYGALFSAASTTAGFRGAALVFGSGSGVRGLGVVVASVTSSGR